MALHTPYRHPALDTLLPILSESAARRDREGGHAHEEKRLLREAGLLNLSIPRLHGGDQLSWVQLYQQIRALATVDSALAHVLAFHHLQVITVLIYGDATQQTDLLVQTREQGLWWGNAMNPLDKRLIATPSAEGYRLTGAKAFCSGTRGSQWMTLSAHVDGQAYPLLAVVPTAQVRQRDDWNPISLQASQELFEMTGAKGTDQAHGFDRFWRNARTHTLHDPLDYKLNQLGRWRLKGQLPNPQYYA